MEYKVKIMPGAPAFYLGNDMRVAMMLVESIELRPGQNGELQAFYKAGGEHPFLVPEEVCHATVEEVLETLLPEQLVGNKRIVLVDAVPEGGGKGKGRGVPKQGQEAAAPADGARKETPLYGPTTNQDADDQLFKG